MVTNAESIKKSLMTQNKHEEGVTFKIKADPRITPIGRFIRKTSIDELPQLLCILKGDMSLVGPRPSLPQEVMLYSLKDRRRLDIKPGLTCFWQVGGRSDIPFSQQVVLDVMYIDSQSIFLDIKLLLKTIPAVIFGRGAY
jgi:lipopolysaccharide/colanic/teichoic acid biosynthesis glycosyltransferase